MKFPVPIPRRAERTLLPAALAALLALLFVVQLAFPVQLVLPEAGVTRPFRLLPTRVGVVAADPEITARPLFNPARREGTEPGTGDKTAPLEGARAVGVITARGAVRLFLQAPDGQVSALGIGGGYRGWRLVRVGAGQAAFRRGGETAVLPITASAPPVAPNQPDPAQAEEETE
ncbi:MAG: hypothetical protein ACOYLS_08130 [Polymorphobacter sp.]